MVHCSFFFGNLYNNKNHFSVCAQIIIKRSCFGVKQRRQQTPKITELEMCAVVVVAAVLPILLTPHKVIYIILNTSRGLFSRMRNLPIDTTHDICVYCVVVRIILCVYLVLRTTHTHPNSHCHICITLLYYGLRPRHLCEIKITAQVLGQMCDDVMRLVAIGLWPNTWVTYEIILCDFERQ